MDRGCDRRTARYFSARHPWCRDRCRSAADSAAAGTCGTRPERLQPEAGAEQVMAHQPLATAAAAPVGAYDQEGSEGQSQQQAEMPPRTPGMCMSIVAVAAETIERPVAFPFLAGLGLEAGQVQVRGGVDPGPGVRGPRISQMSSGAISACRRQPELLSRTAGPAFSFVFQHPDDPADRQNGLIRTIITGFAGQSGEFRRCENIPFRPVYRSGPGL